MQGPTISPSVSPEFSSWAGSDRTLSESYHPTAFSPIDVSYDGYIGTSTDDYYDAVGDSTTGTETVNTSAPLATLPIFVIGFSGTIVLCGLFLLFSEFRERRKLDKRMMMVIQSLSENSDLSGSYENPTSHYSFRGSVNSTGSTTRSIVYGNESRSAHRSHEGSSKIDYVPTAADTCIYDNSDHSSLYYDGHHSDYYAAAEGGERHHHHCNHPHHYHRSEQRYLSHRDRDRDRYQHPAFLQLYRPDDGSLSAVSTLTPSFSVINTPIYDNDVNHHRESQQTMELSDIHRVPTDTKLQSLVELGTIPATFAAAAVTSTAASPSLSPSSSQQQHSALRNARDLAAAAAAVSVTVGPTVQVVERSSKKENNNKMDYSGMDFPLQQLSGSGTCGGRRYTLSDFDAGIASPIVETMADDNDGNTERIGLRSIAEEDDSGWISYSNDEKSDESSSYFYYCDNMSGGITYPEGSIDPSYFKTTELLGEGSLMTMAKLNGYTTLETEYKIIQDERRRRRRREDDNDDDDDYDDDDDDIDIDIDIDSLILPSVDASTMTPTHDYRIHPDIIDNDVNVDNFSSPPDMDKSNSVVIGSAFRRTVSF